MGTGVGSESDRLGTVYSSEAFGWPQREVGDLSVCKGRPAGWQPRNDRITSCWRFNRSDIALSPRSRFRRSPIDSENPHQTVIQVTHPNATFRAVARGMQDQVARFFESNGTIVIHPEPARFFEVPVAGLLPETLNYIP
ncbi:MAG: hypothetical protein ACREBC_08740 [Pyrinomonadaceae bacterium]